MNEPKKTRKVWVRELPGHGCWFVSEIAANVNCACYSRIKWVDGRCALAAKCSPERAKSPCRRYRATLTLDEQK